MYFSRVTYKPELRTTQLMDIVVRSDEYGLHQLIWGIFAGEPDKERDFIYREELASKQIRDRSHRKADPIYYVVSKEQPNLEHPLLNIETKAYNPKLNKGDRFAFRLRTNAVVNRKGKKHDVALDSQVTWLNNELALLDCDNALQLRDKKRLILDKADDEAFERWQDIVDSGPFAEVLERNFTSSQLLEWVLKTEKEAAIIQWWLRQKDKGFEVVANRFGQLPINVDSYQQHHIAAKGRDAKFGSVDLSGEVVVTDPELFKQCLFNGVGRKKGFGCGLMMIRKVI